MIQEASISLNITASAVTAQGGRFYPALGEASRVESQVGLGTAAESVQVAGAQFARLQQSKEAMQQQAVLAREHIARADAIQRLMREMRDNLNAIIKNYPPFPQGSEERERLLNLVAGLRKQIEAVTVPPRESVVPPAVRLPTSMEWLPPPLDGTSSDADIAMAVQALTANIDIARGYGEEIRQQWVALTQPGSDASAVALSLDIGRSMAISGQAIATRMPAL